MQRRDFMRLVAGTIVVLPALGTFAVGCGGESDEAPKSDDPGAPPSREGKSTVYTTNAGEKEHVHTFTVADSDYGAPPPAGLGGSTTLGTAGETHAHTLAIPMADLASVAGGQTIKVTTGESDGHHHIFTLVKIA